MAIGRILNIGSASGGGSKDGSTAMPINDVVVWQKCAGIYGTYKYTTLDEIVNDTACLGALFNNISANSYLSRSEILFDSLIANETTLAIMGNNQLIRDTIATNEMLSVKIGALAESLQLKVFKHRSAVYTSEDSFSSSYLTFNFANGDVAKSSISDWSTANVGPYDGITSLTANAEGGSCYWYYTFATPTIVKRVKHNPGVISDWGAVSSVVKTVQGKDSNGNWIDLGSTTHNSRSTFTVIDTIDNVTAYSEYRLFVDRATYSASKSFATSSENEWYGVRLGLKD